METINVLVFPCGSEIGLELHRSLKDIRFINLYGASSVDDHGKFVYKNYIGGIPYVTDAGFIPALNRCCAEHHIDFVFPAMDSVILALSEHRDEMSAGILTSERETVRVCRNKAETYKALRGCDFLPKVYARAEDVDTFPVLMKPCVGQGSAGVKRIDSREALDYELNTRKEQQVICEYLPGEEYTIDCFTDRHGELRYAACRNRGRVRNGISVHSSLMDPDERVKEIAETINRRLSFRGAWFFQLKRDAQGQYKLLECATRIAGTMCVERAAGINLPLLTLFDAMDMEVDLRPQTRHVVVDRALENVFSVSLDYDEVYIDFDDTIIVHDRVNIAALAFCYQCVQRHIPVTLLTRHDKDVVEDLRERRIAPELFDRIVCIPRVQRKIDHVSPGKKALFIDDSFAERRQMEEAFDVITGGVAALEALIDARQ